MEESNPAGFAPAPDVREPESPPDIPSGCLGWRVPMWLFILTVLTTYAMHGPVYMLGIVTILGAHELGHYVQTRRYGVPATLPFFIPFPNLFGTMGAVILMRPHTTHRRALFDIAITGPLAGLVPALAFSYVGLRMSQVIDMEETSNLMSLGEPLVFRGLAFLVFGALPEGRDIVLHPLAFAGWVGLLITGLNLMPISQLDGGHILYSLVPRKVYDKVGLVLLVAAGLYVVISQVWMWAVMFVLVALMYRFAPHPPAASEEVGVDTKRVVLGWLTLVFLIFGFTPNPLPDLF